jgi:acyl-coenzyme A thioesterase PaaI-like protein
VLADSAGGLAGCYSADPDARRAAFTITLTTSFLDRASTGRLRATGTVMRNGRQVYYSNVDIDCDGRRVAIAQGSFMRAGVRPRGAAAAASDTGTPAAAPAAPGDAHGH